MPEEEKPTAAEGPSRPQALRAPIMACNMPDGVLGDHLPAGDPEITGKATKPLAKK